MAKFNPEVPETNDPSYLTYSNKTSGDQSLATLFSGLGDTFGKAVKAFDEDRQEAIKAEVSGGVEDVNQSLLQVLGTTEEAENQDEENYTPSTEEAEEFGGETNAADVAAFNATPDGRAAVENARRLTRARQDGRVTDVDYWMRMEAQAKKLKARYPGYSAIIDRQFQGITGAIPANAYVQAQRRQYNATLTQATKEEKEWRTYVKSNEQYLPPDYYTRIQQGNPYTQLEVQERVRRLKTRDYQFKTEENEHNRKVREGNANKEDSIGIASDKTGAYVDQIINDSIAPYKDLAPLLKKAQTDAKSLTPQEKAALTQKFGELRYAAEEGIEKILRDPWDDGKTTYYNMIDDPSKIKAIKEQALSRIDSIQKLISDNDFGILNSVSTYNKAIQSDATKKLLESHNYWGLVNAAKELGGGETLNQLFLNQKYVDMQSDAAKAFLDISLVKTVTGQTTSTEETIKKMRDDAKKVGVNANDQRRMFRQEIDNKVALLMSPEAPIQSWQAAATSLYGQKNRNFLSSVASAQRHDWYMKLTSPQVTARMQELGKTDPSVYNDYKAWAKKSFVDLNRDLAAGVQEGVVFRENIDIEYDPKSNHFGVTTTRQGANRAVERSSGSDSLVGSFIKGIEEGLEETSITAVDKLNRQIDNLKPILKEEGKDINEELAKLFHGMGINTDAPKAKTMFQKIRSSILKGMGQETPGGTEDGKTKRDPKADKSSSLSTFSQYARMGTQDATAFLTRVRTDGNENVEGLDPEFSSRLATMLQEAPEEVRQAVSVDSGYRSVEHQRRLWNAALTKYGSARKARRWVAPPGHSYHGKGLAVDLKYASPEAREWIRDNAKKYGLHFPLSNENWHIEMQGSRKPRKRKRTPVRRTQET